MTEKEQPKKLALTSKVIIIDLPENIKIDVVLDVYAKDEGVVFEEFTRSANTLLRKPRAISVPGNAKTILKLATWLREYAEWKLSEEQKND